MFSHPLASFLSEEAPFFLAPDSTIAYHTYTDMADWVPSGLPSLQASSLDSAETNKRPFRMHRFLTGREASGSGSIKPVFGLTAAILIRTAVVGYGKSPAFEVHAPGQWSMAKRVENLVRYHPVLRQARWKEGIIYPGEEEDWEEWNKEQKGPGSGPSAGKPSRRRMFVARSRL